MTPGRSWTAIAAMFVLNGSLFGIWASRIPAVAEQFDLSHAQLGVLLLAMAAGAVCSFPFAGKFVDQMGAAQITRRVAVIYPITLIVIPLAPNTFVLGVALFLFGAAHGAMDVAMNSWGAEVERRFSRRMMSSFHAMFSFGAGIGAFSGYLAVQLNAGMVLHFLVSSMVIAAVTLLLAAISWKSDTTTRKNGSVFAFPSGPLLLVGLVAFCSSLGEGAMADWSAVYLRDVVLADEGTAALGYAAFSVSMVVVRLLGDRITVRFGPVFVTRLGGIIAGTGIFAAIVSPSVVTALAGFAMLGVGYAIIIPLAFSRAANDPDIPPGQAISSVATLGYGGMLLGPPVIGFIAGVSNLQTAFGLLAALAAVIVINAASLK